jgi:hypothetical protein
VAKARELRTQTGGRAGAADWGAVWGCEERLTACRCIREAVVQMHCCARYSADLRWLARSSTAGALLGDSMSNGSIACTCTHPSKHRRLFGGAPETRACVCDGQATTHGQQSRRSAAFSWPISKQMAGAVAAAAAAAAALMLMEEVRRGPRRGPRGSGAAASALQRLHPTPAMAAGSGALAKRQARVREGTRDAECMEHQAVVSYVCYRCLAVSSAKLPLIAATAHCFHLNANSRVG